MTQLPKIVRARLSHLENSEHPDADLLTAFREGELGSTERDRVFNHLSRCAECRQITALALPESKTEVSAAPVSPGSFWRRTPVLRWGTLAACVVIVAGAILIHNREQSSKGLEVALQQPPPSASGDQHSSPAPAREAKSATAAGAPAALSAPATDRVGRTPAATNLDTRQLASANVPTAAPRPPATADSSAVDVMKKSGNGEVQGQTAVAQERAPSPNSSEGRQAPAAAKAEPAFMARPSTETAASTVGGAAKLTDLRAPSWRLSEDGLPERSFGSDQWEKVQVDHKTGFRAIASLGMEVWIGGPGGLLYHSEDMGLNWTRIIPVSRRASLSEDVSGIAFSDHAHGQVTTASGQHWVTADAGKTWEIQ